MDESLIICFTILYSFLIVLHSEGIGKVKFLVDSYTEYLKREKIFINPLSIFGCYGMAPGKLTTLSFLKYIILNR